MWFHSICSCVVKSGTFTALKRCSIRLDTHLFCREFMLIVFIYAYWCPTQFPYQMMFVSFNSTTTGVTCGAGTANPSGAHECTPGFCGVRVPRSLVLCVVDRCLSFCYFSFGHCIICPSIYRFWVTLWYLQTLLIYSYVVLLIRW